MNESTPAIIAVIVEFLRLYNEEGEEAAIEWADKTRATLEANVERVPERSLRIVR